MPLTWPEGDPNTRMQSRGGVTNYTIARCGKDNSHRTVYRWARQGSPWSEAVYDLSTAKVRAEGDYLSLISAEYHALTGRQ